MLCCDHKETGLVGGSRACIRGIVALAQGMCRIEPDTEVASHAPKDAYILKCHDTKHCRHQQCTYHSLKTEFIWETYMTSSTYMHMRSTLARVRKGWHWLQVHGRRLGVPYEHHVCPSCSNRIDDGMHAVKEVQEGKTTGGT